MIAISISLFIHLILIYVFFSVLCRILFYPLFEIVISRRLLLSRLNRKKGMIEAKYRLIRDQIFKLDCSIKELSKREIVFFSEQIAFDEYSLDVENFSGPCMPESDLSFYRKIGKRLSRDILKRQCHGN